MTFECKTLELPRNVLPIDDFNITLTITTTKPKNPFPNPLNSPSISWVNLLKIYDWLY